MSEVTAREIVDLLEEDEQVGTLYKPTYEFINGGVIFRFNDIGTTRMVKDDLRYTVAAQVAADTDDLEDDPFKARKYALKVTWDSSAGFVPEVIERNIRFLITKYKMIPNG
jgi:hypothetical protein